VASGRSRSPMSRRCGSGSSRSSTPSRSRSTHPAPLVYTQPMRAARCRAYGDPDEVVAVEDVPPPAAGVGEVVVDVAAASVNYPDVLLVRNEYQMSVPPPFTPGSDFAGTIRAVGPAVDGWAVGERV